MLIFIILICLFSIALNVLLIWYIRKLLEKLLFVSDNMEDFLEILRDYSDHLETVYNMETYYGDETIEHLLKYSKEVVQEIKAYEEIYTLVYDEEGDKDEEA